MSKISKGMVEHLNRVLKENEVGFRYIYIAILLNSNQKY